MGIYVDITDFITSLMPACTFEKQSVGFSPILHFLFCSISKHTSSDVSRRKWLIPGAEYSIFTGQPLEAEDSPKDNRLEDAYAAYR